MLGSSVRHYLSHGIRLGGRRWYLLWFSDEQDGVITDNQQVLAFPDRKAVRTYAHDRGWVVDRHLARTAQPLQNFDRVQAWVTACRPRVEAPLLLNAWNFLLDVALSVGAEDNLVVVGYREATAGDVYDKLFWGSNLPSVMAPGQTYRPRWSQAERQALQDVLTDGLSLLTRVLRAV